MTTTERRDHETTSAYWCDPEWHNGERVHADYSIIEIEAIEDLNGNGKHDAQAKLHGFHFACCRTHLETAVHVAMVRDAHYFSIREVNKTKGDLLT